MRHMTRAGILLLIVCAGASAQSNTIEFAGRILRLQLPAGYQLAGQANPAPGMRTLGFATAPRADGTRGLIQITLLDFSSVPNEPEPSLARFSAAMIGGVRQRRSQWKEATRTADLDGAPASRIEWSGSAAASAEGPSSTVIMHGVMIVGIKDHIGYSLHTQDLEPFAATTMASAEQALMTFTVQARR
jgi:hypothetical protein